ncbi:SPFH/Band 7/PHB domain protein [Alcaligenes ammonioxydans]|jgi:regulator of protease activity HflC (stomatin/prohibitin superfamily)|uniref:Protein QmcA n=1 Tax=Alcaligenes ammonioxydans TaxID=2582914 RepID=A0ABX8SSC1_9BURK|nr:SPFH domain-containing protein [Alcaligenes ammonioxydans]EJC65892.1 protease [Alcaligenes faecalis subsp. faecalis NCIB 8687]QBH20982.1 SPFH/Band 7/PHB domain protein [Alcaligenes faecalis]MCH1878660.1 SPFH/Band 7/PHB domain protein [Alcaligenes ammonioxydans]QXX78933.1 SPFH/Band 7/PHB domain protein [Alcaligenes ammonioxydans]WGQ37101.1 SPFH/Band 7/PHB domain protein [Alcaligenes faecalis]
MSGSFTFVVMLAFLAVVVVMAGVKVVPQGQQWTVERFGRYTRTLTPGLSLLVPFMDRVGRKLKMMESVLDVPSQNVISRDNVAVTADGVVFYRIDNAAQAAYEIDHLEMAIVNLTTTNLRSVLGSMELDHMLSNREVINDRLLAAVDAATTPWGVKVTRVEIRDLNMAPELQEAMNLQMTAERHRRAVVTKASGQKEAEVLQAEGEKQAAVLRAEGEKQSAILRAEAREREAEAEARATREVSEAIKSGDVQALQYFVGLKYVEALRDVGNGPNSKLVLMPLEASGITGAVAGVAELLKSTAGHSGQG